MRFGAADGMSAKRLSERLRGWLLAPQFAPRCGGLALGLRTINSRKGDGENETMKEA
jgi:hypothetical protein